MRIASLRLLGCMMLVAAIGAGCQSAVSSGRTTMLDGVDLIAMTDDMASRIGSDAEVNQAAASGR
jgi:hypothetical protein